MTLLRSEHTIKADAYLPAHNTDATPAHNVDYPALVVFEEDFESAVTAAVWVSPDGGSVTVSTAQAESGTHSLLVKKAGAGVTRAQRVITGLIPGVRYRIDARARAEGAPVDVSAAFVTDNGFGESATVSGAWGYSGFASTLAISTSMTVQLTVMTVAGKGAYFDNVVVTRYAQTVTVPGEPSVLIPDGSPTPLSVKTAQVTLDDSWTPYAQTSLVCALPGAEALPLLDPRQQRRVKLTMTQAFGDDHQSFNAFGPRPAITRPMDLVLAAREVDHNTGEVTLTLESDEALLRAYGLIATVPYVPAGLTVVRAVTAALERIGARLPGVHRNPIRNPSGTRVLGYANSGGAIAQDAAGTYIIASAARAIGQLAILIDTLAVGVDLLGNQQYTLSANIFGTIAPGLSVSGPGVVVAANVTKVAGGGYSEVSVTFQTTGAGAINLYLFNAAAAPSGGIVAFNRAQIDVGGIPQPYGDGATAGGHWEGAADNSASIIIPTSQADAPVAAEAMAWKPGKSGWDYVAPLVQAAGMRLWCDELRGWHMEPTTTRKDGLIRLTADQNVTRARDKISLLDNAEYFTGVVVRYEWADSAGVTHTQFDTAGTPTKVALIELDNTVYPGPGAAAYILSRAASRGRVFGLTAMSDYLTDPGKALSTDLPNTATQVGYVRSVEWRFPEDEMTVQQRELTQTPSTAWIFDAPGVSWNSIPVGFDWTEDI